MGLGADDYLTKPCTVEQFLKSDRNPPSSVTKKFKAVPKCLLLRCRAIFRQYLSQLSLSLSPPFSSSLTITIAKSISLSDVARGRRLFTGLPHSISHKVTPGRTVKQWITERRMAQAHHLLKSTAYSVRQGLLKRLATLTLAILPVSFVSFTAPRPKLGVNQLTPQSVTITTKQTELCSNRN